MFAIAISTSASAQFYWGAKVGLNLNTLNNKNFPTSDNFKHPMKAGFLAGLTAEYNIYSFGNFSVGAEADLLYAMKGNGTSAKVVISAVSTDYTLKSSVYTDNLQLNVMPKIKYNINDEMDVFLRVGAYFDFALSSVAYSSQKGKLLGQNVNEKDHKRHAIGSDADKYDINPFDSGLQFAAGLDYKGLQFAIGYELGLMNLTNSNLYNLPGYVHSATTNGAIILTVGYRF